MPVIKVPYLISPKCQQVIVSWDLSAGTSNGSRLGLWGYSFNLFFSYL